MKHKLLKYTPLFIAMALTTWSIAGCSNDATPARSPIRLNFSYKNIQPSGDSLYPIYPNPFSRINGDSVLSIDFAMKDSGSPILLIQNVVGDEIAGYSDTALGPGYYSGKWNPIASDGTPLLSGLYFVTLHVHDYIHSSLVNIQNNE